jgi:predicted permease
LTSFSNLAVPFGELTRMLMVAAGLVLVTVAVGAVILRLSGQSIASHLPALAFPNTGNMGLPLCLFAFGEEGLALAAAYFVAASALHFSLGIVLVAGRFSWRQLARTPLLWATGIALILQATATPLPPLVATPVGLVGDMAIPLMLFSLGVSLATLRPHELKLPGVMALGRIGGGLGLGIAAAALVPMGATAAGVVMVQSALPSAVLNYLMAVRFDRSPETVAGTVFVATALSLIVLPVLIGVLIAGWRP